MPATLVIEHRIDDYDAWKEAFDSDPVGRARAGVTGYTIHRPVGEAGAVVINLEFPSCREAESFLPSLFELWGKVGKRVGIGSTANVSTRILEEIERAEI